MPTVGIDPGRDGALAVVADDGKILWCQAFPLVENTLEPGPLFEMFQEIEESWDGIYAFVEKATAMKGQGVSSTFKFGTNYGFARMAVAALGWKYELVHSSRWTKVMHAGVDSKLDSKKKSGIAVQRLFPKDNFLATERSRKPHKGIVDAVLIAEYGRRKLNGAA